MYQGDVRRLDNWFMQLTPIDSVLGIIKMPNQPNGSLVMKEIEISMKMKDTEISSLDVLKNKFNPELFSHFKSGLLSKWLLSQGLGAEFDAISAINKNSSSNSQLAVIFQIFKLPYSEVTLGDFIEWYEFFKKVGYIPSDSQFDSALKLAQQENRKWF